MENGLRIRYGKFVPGYETRAVELFDESSRYYREKVERGELTSFEPFLLSTSDLEEEMGFLHPEGPGTEDIPDGRRGRVRPAGPEGDGAPGTPAVGPPHGR